MIRRYASIIHNVVIKSECRLSDMTGNANNTIVLSNAPINVPRTTMNRMMF